MLPLIARRIVAGVILLFSVSTLTFFLLYLGSGDIARTLLGQSATAEQVDAKAAELGLDDPILERYGDWLASAVKGDFGRSWFTSQTVAQGVTSHLPVTLFICFIVLTLTAVFATALGIAAAVRRGWVDRLVQVLAIAGFAVPPFVIAVVLVATFAVQLGLVPATGYVRITDSVPLWTSTIILPVIALMIASVSSTAQQIRSSFITTMDQDFVRTLRSRGLTTREVLFKHVLKNAAPTGMTTLSIQFIHLLGGSFIVESVFALPGIGFLAVRATSQGNLPMVMGIVVFTAAAVIIVNLLVDTANAWLNPKVRL